ncbi:hypothetical protein FB451DRAFT_1170640 [Mycena latifolia]|nr:hypothetical protein FB451DRAFT_1170640 [Mycena latifolia]
MASEQALGARSGSGVNQDVTLRSAQSAQRAQGWRKNDQFFCWVEAVSGSGKGSEISKPEPDSDNVPGPIPNHVLFSPLLCTRETKAIEWESSGALLEPRLRDKPRSTDWDLELGTRPAASVREITLQDNMELQAVALAGVKRTVARAKISSKFKVHDMSAAPLGPHRDRTTVFCGRSGAHVQSRSTGQHDADGTEAEDRELRIGNGEEASRFGVPGSNLFFFETLSKNGREGREEDLLIESALGQTRHDGAEVPQLKRKGHCEDSFSRRA